MNLLVQKRSVEGSVKPVMPGIFKNEKDGNLVSHGLPGWKRDACGHAEKVSSWVEEPDLRKFDGEVGEEDEFGALPLFGWSRYFVLAWRLAGFSD